MTFSACDLHYIYMYSVYVYMSELFYTLAYLIHVHCQFVISWKETKRKQNHWILILIKYTLISLYSFVCII